MNILLVTQYFYPENFKSNDIAFELKKRGYDITVLTGIPNYPKGRFYEGYNIFKNRCQTIHGVKIKRSFLFPRREGKGFQLAINYLSWSFCASIHAFFLALFNKYDAIIVYGISPITQSIPAIIVKKIKKTPMYFWVLDLWPESLTYAGGVTNKYVLSFFTNIVKMTYTNSEKILISSQGFKQSILEKGNYKDKIIYFPNWAEEIFLNENHLSEIPKIPDGFIVMFAGNIGEAQDFDNIMQCTLLLKENKDIKFVFIGDGRKRTWVDSFITKYYLQETVYTLGYFPIDAMPSLYKRADVMLLSLKNEPIFNLTVPAKLQTYMASGKPIVAMINGEGQNIIKDCNCGLAVNSGNYKKLAYSILTLKEKNIEEREKLGQNGQEYFLEHFKLDRCINNLCSILPKM